MDSFRQSQKIASLAVSGKLRLAQTLDGWPTNRIIDGTGIKQSPSQSRMQENFILNRSILTHNSPQDIPSKSESLGNAATDTSIALSIADFTTRI